MTEKREAGPESARDGAALWARARAPWRESVAKSGDSPGEPHPEPDALTLAAYLDGTLDEAGAAAIETWMAASPEGLDSVLSARAALAEGPAEVPSHVIARAADIVRRRPGSAARSPLGSALFGWFGGLLRPAAWAGAVAAVLLASVSGFELGRAGVEHLTSLDAAVSQDVRLVMGRTGSDLL